MQQRSFLKLIVVSSILTLTSCAAFKNFFTLPEKTPAIHVGDKVKGFALATHILEAKKYDIELFDYGTGTIRTNFLYLNTGILGTTRLRSKLVFSLSPENNLDADFVSIQMHDVLTDQTGRVIRDEWTNANTFFTEYTPIRNNVLAYLDSVQLDSVKLQNCVDNFLGTFKYNYVVLKTLTEVGRSRFIQQYLINRHYRWSLPLVDLVYNKNTKYNKKYVAKFQYMINKDNEFDKLFSNVIFLNVYTDNDSLADYTKRQLVNYDGILHSADETFISENFNFDFFTADGK